MYKTYLRGIFPIIRKTRIVRLIRKMIEEGIMVSRVKEMYEEGMRLLLEMKKEEADRKEGEEGKDTLMTELLLLKYRGEEKGLQSEEKIYISVTSLDGIPVIFPQNDRIKREGNTVIHHGTNSVDRNCFIGGVMTSV